MFKVLNATTSATTSQKINNTSTNTHVATKATTKATTKTNPLFLLLNKQTTSSSSSSSLSASTSSFSSVSSLSSASSTAFSVAPSVASSTASSTAPSASSSLSSNNNDKLIGKKVQEAAQRKRKREHEFKKFCKQASCSKDRPCFSCQMQNSSVGGVMEPVDAKRFTKALAIQRELIAARAKEAEKKKEEKKNVLPVDYKNMVKMQDKQEKQDTQEKQDKQGQQDRQHRQYNKEVPYIEGYEGYELDTGNTGFKEKKRRVGQQYGNGNGINNNKVYDNVSDENESSWIEQAKVKLRPSSRLQQLLDKIPKYHMPVKYQGQFGSYNNKTNSNNSNNNNHTDNNEYDPNRWLYLNIKDCYERVLPAEQNPSYECEQDELLNDPYNQDVFSTSYYYSTSSYHQHKPKSSHSSYPSYSSYSSLYPSLEENKKNQSFNKRPKKESNSVLELVALTENLEQFHLHVHSFKHYFFVELPTAASLLHDEFNRQLAFEELVKILQEEHKLSRITFEFCLKNNAVGAKDAKDRIPFVKFIVSVAGDLNRLKNLLLRTWDGNTSKKKNKNNIAGASGSSSSSSSNSSGTNSSSTNSSSNSSSTDNSLNNNSGGPSGINSTHDNDNNLTDMHKLIKQWQTIGIADFDDATIEVTVNNSPPQPVDIALLDETENNQEPDEGPQSNDSKNDNKNNSRNNRNNDQKQKGFNTLLNHSDSDPLRQWFCKYWSSSDKNNNLTPNSNPNLTTTAKSNKHNVNNLFPLNLYECNFDFVFRFLVDKGMCGFGWIQIDKQYLHETLPKYKVCFDNQVTEVDVIESHLMPCPSNDRWLKIPRLRQLCFDIETARLRPGKNMPVAEHDPVITFCAALDSEFASAEEKKANGRVRVSFMLDSGVADVNDARMNTTAGEYKHISKSKDGNKAESKEESRDESKDGRGKEDKENKEKQAKNNKDNKNNQDNKDTVLVLDYPIFPLFLSKYLCPYVEKILQEGVQRGNTLMQHWLLLWQKKETQEKRKLYKEFGHNYINENFNTQQDQGLADIINIDESDPVEMDVDSHSSSSEILSTTSATTTTTTTSSTITSATPAMLLWDILHKCEHATTTEWQTMRQQGLDCLLTLMRQAIGKSKPTQEVQDRLQSYSREIRSFLFSYQVSSKATHSSGSTGSTTSDSGASSTSSTSSTTSTATTGSTTSSTTAPFYTWKRTNADWLRATADVEKLMLMDIFAFYRAVNADVITGYNIERYDIPYLLLRAAALGIEDHTFLGSVAERCIFKHTKFQSKGTGTRLMTDVDILGSLVMCVWRMIRKDLVLSSYTLNNVAHNVLNNQKADLDYSLLTPFHLSSPILREKIRKYCDKDTTLPLDINDKKKLIGTRICLCQAQGISVLMNLRKGQSIGTRSRVLRQLQGTDLLLPFIRTQEESELLDDLELLEFIIRSREKNYQGATVIDPIRAFYTDPTVVVDFNSLYPSVIMSNNLCMTTKITEQEALSKYKPEDYNFRVINKETNEKAYFLKAHMVKSKLALICEDLLKQRGLAKKQMNALATTNPDLSAIYSLREKALKVVANSVYGWCGAFNSGIREVAAYTTCDSRQHLENTCETAKRVCPSVRVIYGDTDSLFINMPGKSMDEADEIGNKIVAEVNKGLTWPMKIEQEKIFEFFLLLNRKKYSGLICTKKVGANGKVEIERKINSRGIETVRRDCMGMVRTNLNIVLKLLMENKIQEAIDFIRAEAVRLLEGDDVDMQELVISKSISKAEYKTPVPQITVRDKMMKRNPDSAPQVGDRVDIVFTAAEDKDTKAYERCDDPDWVAQQGVPIDYNFYYTKHYQKPFARIFAPIFTPQTETYTSSEASKKKEKKYLEESLLIAQETLFNPVKGMVKSKPDPVAAVLAKCHEVASGSVLQAVTKKIQYRCLVCKVAFPSSQPPVLRQHDLTSLLCTKCKRKFNEEQQEQQEQKKQQMQQMIGSQMQQMHDQNVKLVKTSNILSVLEKYMNKIKQEYEQKNVLHETCVKCCAGGIEVEDCSNKTCSIFDKRRKVAKTYKILANPLKCLGFNETVGKW